MFRTTNQIVIFRGLLDDGSYDGFLMCFDCFLDRFLMVVCGLWMNITKSCVSCCPEYLNFVGGKIPTLRFFTLVYAQSPKTGLTFLGIGVRRGGVG